MWIWSKLSGAQWMDAWEDRFYGNPNTVISKLKTNKTIRVEVYTETEKEAVEIQQQFGGSIRKLVHKNWAAVTEPTRPPIRIRSSLIISGSRDEDARKKLSHEFPGRHIIQIPADMAFGTGDHATTSTCMRFLVDIAQDKKGQDWDMLDLGTGSGVIAIAARMLGARHCHGMDFDPQAVKVARRNVRRNGVNLVKMSETDVLKWSPDRQWPVVVANMFSTILQQAFPVIAEALTDDGTLIISGILKDQWDETRKVAEQYGLSFSKVIRKGKWVTACGGHFTKANKN
ncbi:MAG: 50S ribosomal protein L11 methyltransferase [Verrucomicrobiae bacterium]|nr:50S ribosomal protein L11 methyltransferase [Verrucomicrobiae bacterium]NNJ42817.1 methyltransferase domain-containing protein [Akkermansiaceae bacterium]